MRAALVAPTNLLPLVQPYSNYHLVLAHKVVHDYAYCTYCQQRTRAGDYVILDNGAVEKGGRSIPLKSVVLAAVLIKPTVVVLPDLLFDSRRTLDEVENSLRSPAIKFLRRVHPAVKLCVVVQGVDAADWLECFSILNSDSNGISMLGIPKVTAQLFGSRLEALRQIQRRVKKPCHLLGVWWAATLDEVRQEGQYDFVQGVDTSKPVRLAAHGMTLDQWSEVPRGKDFLDRGHVSADADLVKSNCEKFVAVCRGGST